MDKGYEIEWCVKLPIDESGEADHDAAVYESADRGDLQSARQLAKEKLPLDPYGTVQIRQFEMRPDSDIPGLFLREYISDMIEVS